MIMFQLVSKNQDGKIVARFTVPSVDYSHAASIEAMMGGYDPNGNPLSIIKL
jgi:hypothetical protein